MVATFFLVVIFQWIWRESSHVYLGLRKKCKLLDSIIIPKPVFFGHLEGGDVLVSDPKPP